MEQQTDTRYFQKLNGNMLKAIACAAMFCDHAVKALQVFGTWRFVLSDVIGRIAFPLFCFFLVEGFLHSKNRRAYFLRLLVFAILAEVPFDLAFHGRAVYTPSQNTLFTLTLGLLLLITMDFVQKKKDLHIAVAVLLHVGLLAAFEAAAHFLHLDYGARGQLCIAAIYLLRNSRPRTIPLFWGCVSINLNYLQNPGAFFSLIPLHYYNGTRGKARLKYAFYAFYPLHLLLLFLLARVR